MARRKKKRRTRYQTKAWMNKIRPKGKRRRKRASRKNPGAYPKVNRVRRRRRRRARRNPPRGRTMKSVKRRGKPVSRAAWKASGYRRNPMARKRRRVRRRYRRNPPIIKTVQRGAMDAFAVVTGKAIARTVPTLLKLPTTGAVGIAVQALAAVAAGMVLRTLKLGGRDFERLAVAGGLAAPIESFIKGANIPFLSSALEGYGAYPQYAQLSAGELTDVFGTDVGSYPEYGY